jgi:hypothetical protein
VYDSPDKIPADFCADATTASTSTSSPAPTGTTATAQPVAGGGGTMKTMDTTCYYINGMIICDP